MKTPPDRPLIELDDVTKVYGLGHVEVRALQDVTLSIREGEIVAIMGRSGSGKSTLMNIIGCLDVPDVGRLSPGLRGRSRDERRPPGGDTR